MKAQLCPARARFDAGNRSSVYLSGSAFGAPVPFAWPQTTCEDRSGDDRLDFGMHGMLSCGR